MVVSWGRWSLAGVWWRKQIHIKALVRLPSTLILNRLNVVTCMGLTVYTGIPDGICSG